jgi:hypothetical protein
MNYELVVQERTSILGFGRLIAPQYVNRSVSLSVGWPVYWQVGLSGIHYTITSVTKLIVSLYGCICFHAPTSLRNHLTFVERQSNIKPFTTPAAASNLARIGAPGGRYIRLLLISY